MANTFVNLPLPLGNGVGPAVDTSMQGSEKSIVVNGNFPGAVLTIEASVDGGVTWGSVASFATTKEKKKVFVVANRMRVRVAGRSTSPFTGVNVDVGAPSSAPLFFSVPSPAAGGQAGAPLNVSAGGVFKTITLLGPNGQRLWQPVFIEVSQDGVAWAGCQTFNSNGIRSFDVPAQFIRARSAGQGTTAGMIIALGADEATGGGSLSVEDEGILVGSQPTMNFIGDGVMAADDAGNNRINVTVSAANVGDVLPLDVDKSAADPGVSPLASRIDHKHDVVTAVPVPVNGAFDVEGVAASLARSDHHHRLELDVSDEGVLAGARPEINFVGAGVGAVDNPGAERVDVTIPGGLTADGAVVLRTDYGALTLSTSGLIFISAGLLVTIPIDGNYWAIFEGEGDNQSGSGVLDIAISVNSLVLPVVNSQRESGGSANDARWVGTSMDLGALTAGDFVRVLFRKASGGGSVDLMRRRLTVIKYQ